MSTSKGNSIRSVTFDGMIWNAILSNDLDALVLDVRKEQEEAIGYFKLDIQSLQFEKLPVSGVSWRSRVDAYDGALFVTEYPDEKDPTRKVAYKHSEAGSEEVSLSAIPYIEATIKFPMLYEQDSEHHKTVCDFLSVDLVLSCEYLEVGDKIIISYYLRSGKEFARHLLVLDGGKKELKEIQDANMKGFASGAFFVFKNELYFVKNRNEICLYPL